MTRWYRAYEGTVSDPKLAEAALVTGCSRSVAISAWHCILENAAALNDSGRIDIPTRRIAATLCEPLDTIEMLFSSFLSIGLVVDAHVAAWNRRQYTSDSSTERSRNSRARKRNGDATLQQRSATPPKTETETEGSEPIGSGGSPSAIDVQKVIFDTGVSILTASGRNDREARSMLGRWRKEYSDSEVLTALSRCQVERPSEPVEWITKALQAERNKANGQSNGRPADRGPDPILDALARATAEAAAAERASAHSSGGFGTGHALPAQQARGA